MIEINELMMRAGLRELRSNRVGENEDWQKVSRIYAAMKLYDFPMPEDTGKVVVDEESER